MKLDATRRRIDLSSYLSSGSAFRVLSKLLDLPAQARPASFPVRKSGSGPA